MKISKLATAVLLIVNSTFVVAADNVGTVHFIGSVSSTTCTFDVYNENGKGGSVNLGEYTAAEVVIAGTTPKGFSLVATNTNGTPCTITTPSAASIVFSPVGSAWQHNYLENEGNADNVGVQLLDSSGAVIGLGNATVKYTGLNIDTARTLEFQARLVKTSTTEAVTYGTVDASVLFAVAYH